MLRDKTMVYRITIVIPTRNRSDLAIRSISSVLDESGDMPLRLIVSDNSTEPAHSRALADYVASRQDKRTSLIRPSRSLAMTQHWEWAVSHALEDMEASHVLFLTDRMAFRRKALRDLMGTVRDLPHDVISYTYDRLDDFSRPVRFKPLPRSGHVFRVPSSKLVADSSRMTFYSCLPRMLNCVAPRSHLMGLREKFGTVFESVSPDYCFCYRTLSFCESIVYVDKSLLVNFAQDKSNGGSISRGVPTRDSADFRDSLPGRINEHSPLPAIITVGNAVVNEYCAIRGTGAGAMFPEVATDKYLDFLALEIAQFLDRDLRSAGWRELTANGWKRGIQYWWSFWKRKAINAVALMGSVKFESADDAYIYAVNSAGWAQPLLDILMPRYGSRIRLTR